MESVSAPFVHELFLSHKEQISSFHEAELVHIALKCAVDVYETERKTRTITGSFYFEESRFIHPSPMGTTKAASFTTIHPLGTQNVADTLLPAFVVAIRGTENLVAHMVNLNGLPKDFPLRTVSHGEALFGAAKSVAVR